MPLISSPRAYQTLSPSMNGGLNLMSPKTKQMGRIQRNGLDTDSVNQPGFDDSIDETNEEDFTSDRATPQSFRLKRRKVVKKAQDSNGTTSVN